MTDQDPFLMTAEPSRVEPGSHQPTESIADSLDMEDALLLNPLDSTPGMADDILMDTGLDPMVNSSGLIMKSVEEILREGGKRSISDQDEDEEKEEDVSVKRRRSFEEDTLEENIDDSREFEKQIEEDTDIVDAEAVCGEEGENLQISEDADVSIKK